MTRVLRTIALLFVCFACAPGVSPVGVWHLWTVEGVPPEAAPAERFEMPAGRYGNAIIQPGDVWTESRIEFATLEILADTAFEETMVHTRTIVSSPTFYRRSMGRDPTRQDQLRGAPSRDTTRVIGQWRILASDSIILTQRPEQVRATLQAATEAAFPSMSRDLVIEAVERAMSTTEIPDRGRGRIFGDRLELTDVNGRRLVYRRRE